MIGTYFANELEKMARISVKGGRGATGPKGGVPLGVTQPRKEPGKPQAPSGGMKIKGFAQRTKSSIKQSVKPGLGTLGKWG